MGKMASSGIPACWSSTFKRGIQLNADRKHTPARTTIPFVVEASDTISTSVASRAGHKRLQLAGDLDQAVQRGEIADNQIHVDIDAGFDALRAYYKAASLVFVLHTVDGRKTVRRRHIRG